jgi:hypothetical protein
LNFRFNIFIEIFKVLYIIKFSYSLPSTVCDYSENHFFTLRRTLIVVDT